VKNASKLNTEEHVLHKSVVEFCEWIPHHEEGSVCVSRALCRRLSQLCVAVAGSMVGSTSSEAVGW
jgi:hypothetical protein